MNILDRYEDNKEYLRKLSEAKERVFLRRSRIVELNVKGKSQQAIADTFHVAASTVNSGLQVLRRQARTNIQTYVEHQLPFEHNSLMVGIPNYQGRLGIYWKMRNHQSDSKRYACDTKLLRFQAFAFG